MLNGTTLETSNTPQTTTPSNDARDGITTPDASKGTATRTVPADLMQTRSGFAYVVTHAATKRGAEQAIGALRRVGFEQADFVLVSEDVHQIRPFPDNSAIEVSGPTSVSRAAGLVSGLGVGTAAGAAAGLIAQYFAVGSGPYGVAVAIGAAIGAVAGLLIGPRFAARMRRHPGTFYDESDAFGAEDILVGVALQPGEHVGAAERAVQAETALRLAGFTPRRLPGDSSAA